MSNKIRVEKKIGSGVLAFDTGWLAKQSAACVLCQYNDTIVLNAVTTGAPRPGIDFFPLTCDYRERSSAAGKFPGGFLKREGRPSIKETLTSRLIDRPIRPMFAEGFADEVQCQAMVLSSDRQTDGDVLAMNGVAAALLISHLPFEEPVASVRVARINGEFLPFPTHSELEDSDLDLIVSGTKASVTMIEGFAREMPEQDMAEAIEFAHRTIVDILDLMEQFRAQAGVEKMAFSPPTSDGLYERLSEKFYDQLRSAKQTPGKQDRAEAVRKVKEAALAELIPDPAADNAFSVASFERNWHQLTEKVVRDLILSGTRPDGRDAKTLRNIECHTGVLPRVHGSAVFQRGETQALITVTLGTARDEQRVDGLQDEYSKKFMLDYNFPPFSVGECKPIRGPGRREIGHGMLAERSVKPVLPSPEEFPYTIRVISDILESNGSSSMASVCGATLGLMDAGVKISNPVAGISIGLVQENPSRWTLLTDIIGDEDHYGDMDFKVAGTPNGITGIQLDLKIRGISFDIIRATLSQAREARIEILKKMLSTIRQPREAISIYAPRMVTTQIDPDKIGLVIGPGGKNIRAIQEETQTVIEIEDSGRVMIAGTDQAMTQKALERIELMTATVQVGKIYTGVVSSIKDFGCFVEILPGRDGLCHISELSSGYVGSVYDVCQVGDEMKVLVIDVDDNDRVKLSRRRALEELGEVDEFAPADDSIDEVDDEFEDDEDFEDEGDDFDGDDTGDEYDADFEPVEESRAYDDRGDRGQRGRRDDRGGGRSRNDRGGGRNDRGGGRNGGRSHHGGDRDGGRGRHGAHGGGRGGGNQGRGGHGGGQSRGRNGGGRGRNGGNRAGGRGRYDR